MVEIERVCGPPVRDGHGHCNVRGTVAAVERGARYSVGEDIEIAVPCRRDGAAVPIGGVQGRNVDALVAFRWGRAWLTAEGTLALYQYEILASYP